MSDSLENASSTKAPVENEVAKKKWAESDSDSEDDVAENESVDSSDDEDEKEEVESESESESESEDEKLDMKLLSKITAVEPKKKANVPLTKKEKKEQRDKELLDMEAVLNEFGANTIVEEKPKVEVTEVKVADPASADAKAKKNKKKKAASVKKAAAPEAEVKTDAETVTVIGDVSSIFKMRAAKKGTSGAKAPVVSEAQKIAMSEALKSAASKKKRGDKTKFNECSY